MWYVIETWYETTDVKLSCSDANLNKIRTFCNKNMNYTCVYCNSCKIVTRKRFYFCKECNHSLSFDNYSYYHSQQKYSFWLEKIVNQTSNPALLLSSPPIV